MFAEVKHCPTCNEQEQFALYKYCCLDDNFIKSCLILAFMKIHKGKLSDAKEILRIINITPEFGGSTIKQNHSLNYVRAFLTDKMCLALVAEEDNNMVGFILTEVWKKHDYSFVSYLYVKPGYRRKKVASKLLEAYEDHCKKMRLGKISLLVKTSNTRMQAWCKKNKLKKGEVFYYFAKKL